MWHETSMTFTYESDWRGANRSMQLMMRELLEQHHAEQRSRLEASWEVIEENPSGPLLKEYISAEDHGIQITLRFLCGIESAREIKHCFTTKMLHVVRVNNSLNLAYPTRRMVGPAESKVSSSPSHSAPAQARPGVNVEVVQEKPKRTFTHPIEKIEMTA